MSIIVLFAFVRSLTKVVLLKRIMCRTEILREAATYAK